MAKMMIIINDYVHSDDIYMMYGECVYLLGGVHREYISLKTFSNRYLMEIDCMKNIGFPPKLNQC